MNIPEIKILLAIENAYYERLIEREISQRIPEAVVLFARNESECARILFSTSLDLTVLDRDNQIVNINTYRTQLAYVDNPPQLLLLGSVDDGSSTDIKHLGMITKNAAFPGDFPVILRKLAEHAYHRQETDTVETRPDRLADVLKVTSGTLAHEINNPLMSIIGTCELILDESYAYDTALAQKVRVILHSANRIEKTLKKLSRINNPVIRETSGGKLIDTKKSTS